MSGETMEVVERPKGRFFFGLCWLIIGILLGSIGTTWYFSQHDRPVGDIVDKARTDIFQQMELTTKSESVTTPP